MGQEEERLWLRGELRLVQDSLTELCHGVVNSPSGSGFFPDFARIPLPAVLSQLFS
ncbi:hypothetical protein [Desulforhopalus sp. IMCC35007]|uniref:hypothetical protein n=1 Tax=Desulforhopalus sp. IMCC35007 TaxID=2569543 RepID=UPI00145D7023|nr:hypothetical protein [Desulforhopalus sp. IMCC35007]